MLDKKKWKRKGKNNRYSNNYCNSTRKLDFGTTYVVYIILCLPLAVTAAAQLSNSSIDHDDYNATVVVGCSPVLLIVIAHNIRERTHNQMFYIFYY